MYLENTGALVLKPIASYYARHDIDQSAPTSEELKIFNTISKCCVMAYHFFFITVLRNKYSMYTC